jgi:hypothetical protein
MATVDLVAVSPSALSSFGLYRRKQDPAALARELQQPPTQLTPGAMPARRIDMAGLNAAMHRLTASPDPLTVFTQLAVLLVPAACDEAFATVYSGDELTRRRPHPPAPERPTGRIDRTGPGWTLTVSIAGQPVTGPSAPVASDYLAERRGKWH